MLDTSGQDRVISDRSGKKPMLMKLLYGVLALAAVGILLSTVSAVQRLTSSDLSVPRDVIRVATVQRGDLERDIAVDGTVVASNSPGIYAPTSGIINLHIKPGDPVGEAQLLARIESPELESQLIQEQATLEQSRLELQRQEIQTKNRLADLQNAKELSEVNLELERSKKKRADLSIESQIISQADYELRVAELRKAEFEHKHAVENLRLQTENLEFEISAQRFNIERQQHVVDDLARQVEELELRSPINGVVGSISIKERDNVQANTLLITLVDLTTLEIDLAIPENFADDLAPGMRGQINFNNVSRQGELISISPEVEEGFVGGRMGFAESFTGLRQNQRVNVRIIIEQHENILKVRNGAFVESGGGRVAYVIQNNIAQRRPITVGARSIAEVEVSDGLSEGEQIIISSLDRFNGVERLLITD